LFFKHLDYDDVSDVVSAAISQRVRLSLKRWQKSRATETRGSRRDAGAEGAWCGFDLEMACFDAFWSAVFKVQVTVFSAVADLKPILCP